METKKAAAINIQRNVRGHLARKQKAAATTIQVAFRDYQEKKAAAKASDINFHTVVFENAKKNGDKRVENYTSAATMEIDKRGQRTLTIMANVYLATQNLRLGEEDAGQCGDCANCSSKCETGKLLENLSW